MSENTESSIIRIGPGAVLPHQYAEEDVGAGFDNQTAQDYTIPMIVVCQAKTPAVEDEEHDARAGDWLNTVTDQVYSREEGFELIAALTEHRYAKWISRDDGGGFRGHVEIDDPVVSKAIENSTRFGRYEIEETVEDDRGREKTIYVQLRETFYVYGIITNLSGHILSLGVCIPFTSTKIRAYKRWMTKLRQYPRAPLFAHRTRLTTKQDSNDKGTFYIPVAKPADPRGVVESLLAPDDPRFTEAKKLRGLILAGKKKVDFEGQQQSEGSEDDIPF